MNGSVPSAGQREGRVEICYQNVYGSVCDDFFDESAAAVVCNGTGESSVLFNISILKQLVCPQYL